MSKPPLTVGMPVFNGAPFLAQALDSILSQTFGDFRFVISDNGSTDETESICREYASRDTRIEYLRYEENRGAAWNYNNAFRHCDTLFFRWSAADDLAKPTCFEKCMDAITGAPPSVVMCFPQTLIIDSDGETIEPYDDNLDLRSPQPQVRVRQVIETMVLGNPAFGFVRSETLRRTRGHGSYPSADYVLMVELALQGEIWQVPERLFLRRMHAGTSRSRNPSPQEFTAWHDPRARPVKHEQLRLLREYVAAVRHAGLPRAQSVTCYTSVITAWNRRYDPLRRSAHKARSTARRALGRA